MWVVIHVGDVQDDGGEPSGRQASSRCEQMIRLIADGVKRLVNDCAAVRCGGVESGR